MRYIISLLVVCVFSFSMSVSQMNTLSVIYNTCKNYEADDGFTFEKTCAAIAITESSAGKTLIGDQGSHPEILVNSSLGAMQVRVRTALEVFKKFPSLRYKYAGFWHKDIDAIKTYVPLLKKMSYYKYRANSAASSHNIKIYRKWQSKYLKAKEQFAKYKSVYHKDLYIAEALLSDVKFNATIAVHYLILNYETAKSRKYWNPWWKAISRYNGGWNNRTYVNKVIMNIKIVKKLEKKKILGSCSY